jgi:type I restriction enzyme, S subunit
MVARWEKKTVAELQSTGALLLEDGNHGENRPRPDEFTAAGVQFIRAADMDSGRVLFESAQRINDVALQRVRKGIGAGGDVLLSHKGTVGKVAYVPLDAPPFVCSPQTTFWRVRDPQQLDRRYLYYFLRSRPFHEQLDSRKGETDMADYVSLTTQRTLKVTVPPLAEQKAIASVLGALDDKIELNRRMNATLEAMARALFQSWFVDFNPVRAELDGRQPTGLDPATAALFPNEFEESQLGAIPKGWRATNLREVVEVFDSKRVPLSGRERAQRRGPYPYYGAASVMDYVDDYLFDGVYMLMGEDGSVINEDGTPITQYVWGKFWVNNHAHVLRGKNGISTEHLLLHLNTANISAFVTGAVQPKLNQANMNRIEFLLPSAEVATAFGNTVEPLFAQIRANTDQSRALAAIRDGLLPKLLNGEVSISVIQKHVLE